MQQAHYLLRLLELCTEHQFGQDAIEHAIFSRRLVLTWHLETDLRLIMPQYDQLILEYRASRQLAAA